MSTISQ